MPDALRILLADDEPLALERLVFALQDISGAEIIGTASNGFEAAEKIRQLRPDVAVLDIQMPGRTGLSVVADLPQAERPDIIFLTAFEQHAVDAFEVDATDYILKPLRLDRLRQAIERVRRRRMRPIEVPRFPADIGNAGACFWVQSRGRPVRVAFADITWIEAAKDYVLLHTEARSHILRATMSGIEEQVNPSQFVRTHRSAFVSPAAVRALQYSPSGGLLVLLKDGAAVPVGPTYQMQVERSFGHPSKTAMHDQTGGASA